MPYDPITERQTMMQAHAQPDALRHADATRVLNAGVSMCNGMFSVSAMSHGTKTWGSICPNAFQGLAWMLPPDPGP